MSEGRVRELLRAQVAPGEEAAEGRSWPVVRAAFERGERLPLPASRRRRSLAIAAFSLTALVAASLSPVGEAVGEWVRDAVKPGHEPARKALVSLPARGRLLVTSRAGPWIVQRDGSRRLLGPYEDASWSPHGLFVAATRGSELFALETGGHVRWSLARAGSVRGARWSPDGFRVAYLDGSSLRVVTADGTGDGLLARRVARAPAAWRPGSPHLLAFADDQGRIEVAQADSGHELWRSARGELPTQLTWSEDGKRLLALDAQGLRLFGGGGESLRDMRLPPEARLEAGAFAPSGRRLAVIRHNARRDSSDLLLMSAGRGRGQRRLFAGPGRFAGLAWSPNGRWLLIAWRDADQWLFIPSAAARKIEAVSNISRQFDPSSRRPAFPGLGGWCCP
jgi:dipeptidyl aminopeptidase/acylaminoacyl peptidase